MNAVAYTPARFFVAMVLSLVLAGCTYQGGLEDNLLAQRLYWASFVDGDDIRENCRAGGADRYRFVYNAQYEKQLRAYDLFVGEDGEGRLISRVQRGGTLDVVDLRDPLASFGWQRAENELERRQTRRFERLLRASGFFEPTPDGLFLYSQGFYWTGVSCRDGEVHFNAWFLREGRDDHLRFVDLLFAWDKTGVKPREPFKVDPGIYLVKRSNPQLWNNYEQGFQFQVGENGLRR